MTDLELKVARWICILNSWGWPSDLPGPPPPRLRRDTDLAMHVLQAIVPYEQWIVVWNEDEVWQRDLPETTVQ